MQNVAQAKIGEPDLGSPLQTAETTQVLPGSKVAQSVDPSTWGA